MKIDISRLNLTERDIEDWLYANPRALGESYPNETYITKWIGRQYHLPSGIADLIGVRHNGKLVVVEVKNVPINKAAVLQVCRYATDLSDIVGNRDGYRAPHSRDMFDVQKILVGPSIDRQTFQETLACNVRVMQFDVDLRLTLGQLSLSMDDFRQREDHIKAISLRDEWSIFGAHYSERSIRSVGKINERADEYDELLAAIVSDQDTTDSEE